MAAYKYMPTNFELQRLKGMHPFQPLELKIGRHIASLSTVGAQNW